MSDTLPPPPDFSPSFRPRWLSDNGGFTADQMRAYASAAVAAERERFAQLLEVGAIALEPHALRSAAAAIRAET